MVVEFLKKIGCWIERTAPGKETKALNPFPY